MKKLLNKVLTGSANSAQDSLEKHNLLFSKKKKNIYIYIYMKCWTWNTNSVSKQVLRRLYLIN